MNKWMVTIIGVALSAAFATPGAVAQNPQRVAISPNATVAELEGQGDSLRSQKDYPQAIQFYRAALRKNKKSAGLYNKVGLAELQVGDYRSAQSDFEKAVKYEPNFTSAINNVGVSAYTQKRYSTAVKYLKRALALNEADATIHCNLGSTWFAMEKFDRANAEFTRALELDPGVLARMQRGGVTAQVSPEARAKYAYMLAKLYAKRGDFDNALQSLRKAKEEGYPKIADVYKDQEFAALVQDARLAAVVPPKR